MLTGTTEEPKIVVESDRIYAENWNRSNRHGRINPNGITNNETRQKIISLVKATPSKPQK
jgi:hypothetical protein